MLSSWQSAATHIPPAIGCDLGSVPVREVCRMLVGLAVFAILVSGMGAETLRDPIKKQGAGPLFQIHHGKKWG